MMIRQDGITNRGTFLNQISKKQLPHTLSIKFTKGITNTIENNHKLTGKELSTSMAKVKKVVL